VHRPPWTRDPLLVAATLAAAAAAAGLVVVPLVKLGQVMFEDGGSSVARVLRAPGLGTAALHTLLLACVVPLIAVPLGAAAALALRRADVPGRRLLRLAIVLPLIVPQFVLGYSWTQAYGRAGFTDTVLGVWWTRLDGPLGIVVVLVVDAAPLCYLLTTVGLATRAQPELERAAHISGASPWTTLRTVTLPLLRPVLAAELVLTFVAAMESFAVPQVLGAPSGFATLTTRIYADLSLASDPDSFLDAVTLALGLVVIAAAVLLPADLVLAPRLRATRTGQPAGAEVSRRRTWRAAGPALLIAAYTLVVVGLPTLALLAAAVTRAIGLPPTPTNWTLDNFRAALDGPTVDAIWHSVQLAALAACALTALGVLAAALERRGAGRALGTITILTFAIPGSALAVGLLIAYGRWFDAGLGLILVAYLAKFWALAHRTLSGAVDRLPPAEWQAARTSGARAPVAVATIWLPSLAPALLGAWVLVLLSALHEVTMSSLLYSFGNQTLAVAVLNRQEIGDVGATAALSVILTALVLAAAVPAGLLLRLTASHRAAVVARPPAPVITGMASVAVMDGR
jgi:iron(III) transport system permease protein